MVSRLVNSWVYGGFLSAIMLLAMAPAVWAHWSFALRAIFLSLPFYMLHQYEEHDNERFRHFANKYIGGGREVLSRIDIFIINIPGVWGYNMIAFVISCAVNVGYGLAAIYLMIINAVGHVAFFFAFRRYNPGLMTAVFLFLPLSAWGMIEIEAAGGGSWPHHLMGLSFAILVHALIVARIVLRRRAVD